MKVSHEEAIIIDCLIDWLRMKYDDVNKVKSTRGKIHDYLGMKLDFSDVRKVKINMSRDVTTMIENFEYKHLLREKAKTPAADHLF